MSTAFIPLGTNYLLSLADDSALYTLTIADTNSIGTTWQVSNLDAGNVAYVHISTEEFDSSAVVPAGRAYPEMFLAARIRLDTTNELNADR